MELASIGPIPFCGMVLGDLGADIVRVDRPTEVAGADPEQSGRNALDRGRRSIGVDLKHPDGVGVVLRLVERADVLIEGFRPGVAERLGVGPDVCRSRNERLVYGRMTGWGRTGPLADRAGHDIDYIAIAGALSAFGARGGPPTPPINVVGDFGGGGLLLAFGLLAALVERGTSGQGQVVDAAM
ncbi:MAG: alpha-methylacyl-CoA racemase, partial [Acidimicrobiaceae bacterium]